MKHPVHTKIVSIKFLKELHTAYRFTRTRIADKVSPLIHIYICIYIFTETVVTALIEG